jgi:adenylate kinase
MKTTTTTTTNLGFLEGLTGPDFLMILAFLAIIGLALFVLIETSVRQAELSRKRDRARRKAHRQREKLKRQRLESESWR